MSSPWINISNPKPVNLKDIIKEESILEYNLPPVNYTNQIQGNNQQNYNESCEDCTIDSDDDDVLEYISNCKEWKRFDDIVKERSHKTIKTITTIPRILPQAYRKRIHNQEKHLKAELNLSEYTRIIINNMIKAKYFNSISGVISIGEECVVLHADSNPSYEKIKLPKELAIKVFNTDKRINNKIVYQTAESEMNNLNCFKKVGITCPDVIALKGHVLVMSFIGDNHIPACKLKSVDEENLINAYPQVIDAIKTLYKKSNLVYHNLSVNNILWHNSTSKCYFIDIDRLVELSDENAITYLLDNCKRISHFFKRRIPKQMVGSRYEIFTDIVGVDYNDKIAFAQFLNNHLELCKLQQ